MQRQRRHREAEMSRRVISARLLSGDLLGCRLRVIKQTRAASELGPFILQQRTRDDCIRLSVSCPTGDIAGFAWYRRGRQLRSLLVVGFIGFAFRLQCARYSAALRKTASRVASR